MNKERDNSIDLIRAVCALGIVLFHFYGLTKAPLPRLFYEHANGSVGNTLVNIFFMISGYVLYQRHRQIPDLKTFYKKRFISIYPMFYMVFLAVYLYVSVSKQNFLYGGHPAKLLLTVLGLDGYLLYRIPNYYQVGEWFLGAIILLYALYPLILKVFRRSEALMLAISAAFYATVFIPGAYIISPSTNLFSCLISFVLGMTICSHRELWAEKTAIPLICTAVSAVIIFVRLPYITQNISVPILAFAMFFVLYFLGSLIMKNRTASRVFMEISRLSYPCFLIHHILLQKALQLYMPQSTPAALAFWLMLTIVILAASKVVYLLDQVILKKLTPVILKPQNTE